MLGHFLMKYQRPLTYGLVKTMANIIHDHCRRAQAKVGPIDIGRPHTAAEREACIYQIALALPRLPTPAAPIYRAHRASTPRPFVAKSTPYVSRPAAVKSNGGLRGSTATRWR